MDAKTQDWIGRMVKGVEAGNLPVFEFGVYLSKVLKSNPLEEIIELVPEPILRNLEKWAEECCKEEIYQVLFSYGEEVYFKDEVHRFRAYFRSQNGQ